MSEATEAAEAKADKTQERLAWLELFAVLLMALTAVLTAWSAFEASKWGGVMSIRFNEGGAARTESIRASNEANRQITIDVSLFTNYVDAFAQGETELATFYQDRFPDRLAVANDAWLATKPLQTADAPASPFEMKEYVLTASVKADALERKAEQKAKAARQANQRGDNYTITSVLFATVLLLAALSSKVRGEKTAILLVAMATVLFISAFVVIATYPVEI